MAPAAEGTAAAAGTATTSGAARASEASPTAELAGFLAGLRGGVDERLLGRAAGALTDTVGCMVFGATQPWSQAAIGHALATGGAPGWPR